jgi:hypothetical protein
MTSKFLPYYDEHKNKVSKTYILDTQKDWETVWMSAWVHGNEYAWVYALKDFKEKVEGGIISINKGKIILILEWNQQALQENVRCIDPHSDLNRVIHGVPQEYKKDNYEQNRWKQIKKLIDNVCPHYWLDLHTVSSSRAKPYLFSGIKGYYEKAQNLWINNIAINWSNTHKWKTKESNPVSQWVADYVNYTWSHGFTFEAWNHESPEWAVNSYQAIINFLVSLDMMKWYTVIQNNKNMSKPEFLLNADEWVQNIWNEKWKNHVHMEYYHTFIWGFEYIGGTPYSFTRYKKWELIGYDISEIGLRKEVFAKFDGYIILPKDPKICIPWKEVFFYGKDIKDIL